VAQTALRVDGAVDRIDDDVQIGVTEGLDPELLRDEREVVSLLVQGLEPRDDCLLGCGVDRRRVVAAFPGGDHGLAVAAARQVDEHLPDVRRCRAAGLEPRSQSSVWNSRPESSFG
jgi:hypothetical protein